MKSITKYNISDSQPGLFAGNKKFLSSVTIFSDYNYTQQVLYSSYLAGLRFKQVPIQFNERKFGQSFVKLSYPFKAMFQIFILMITKNPMKTFGLLSSIFIATSLVVSFFDISSYFLGVTPKPIMKVNLVLGSGLLGVQLLFTGVILKSISNIENYIRKWKNIILKNNLARQFFGTVNVNLFNLFLKIVATFILGDLLGFEYKIYYPILLVFLIAIGYFLHSKYVFKSTSGSSATKYVLHLVFFNYIDYIILDFLISKFSLYQALASLIVTLFLYIFRFFSLRIFVFDQYREPINLENN